MILLGFAAACSLRSPMLPGLLASIAASPRNLTPRTRSRLGWSQWPCFACARDRSKTEVQAVHQQGFATRASSFSSRRATANGCRMAGLKARELRAKSKSDLEEQLKTLKGELGGLRVAKVTGGAPNKLAKIKTVRKDIARVLTVLSQNQREAHREQAKRKKYMPLDLRPKKTRALRRALSTKQKTLKTQREKKRISAFPMRKFALKVQ